MTTRRLIFSVWAWLLASAVCVCPSLEAAITVNGVADKTRYDDSVTFTVIADAGYTTTATVDGQPVATGVPVTVNSVRYHVLNAQKQPAGGGTAETLALGFIVRNSVRITTEDGIPSFTPPPLVNDAPSAFTNATLTTVAPAQFPQGLAVPVLAFLRNPNGQPLWLNGTIRSTNFPAAPFTVHRGWGGVLLPAFAGGGVTAYDAHLASLSVSAPVVIDTATTWVAKSGVIGSQDWGNNARIDVTSTLTISSGSTVHAGPGSVVRVAPGAEIIVDGGTLDLAGTLAQPITVTPATPAQPWGGLRLTNATGSTLKAVGTIFTGSGADQTWFNTHGGYSVHRREQACLLVDVGAQATLTNCFMFRLAGQAMHLKSGTLNLTDCLIQGATSGGELTGGNFSALRCGFFEFPDTTTNFVDGDNDGLYLAPGSGNTYTLRDCAVGITKDDGFDSNNGTINVTHCWIENCFHEGFSPSTTGHVSTVVDTVFFHCGQGLEHGYGTTTTTANHCLLLGCENGLRSGDNYGPGYTYGGTVTAQNCVSIFNEFNDVWGYEWLAWTYRSDRMAITSNYLTAANALHPNNLVWSPSADGALLDAFMPVAGSNVGVGVPGLPHQAPVVEYPGVFDVRLSTFSSRPVSVAYTLSSRSDAAATVETVVGAGTLQFAAGETLKTVNLPLPTNGHPGFLRLALSQPANAEVTDEEHLFFDAGNFPADQTLIAKGSAGWAYQALRAEPTGAWRNLAYAETAWQANKAAPIGFGVIGATAAPITLGTTLTTAEQGSATDRTRAVYFRKHFQVADPRAVRALTLNIMRDDGAVVYLNGQQIGRNNIDSGSTTGGTISHSTLATRTVDLAEESAFVPMPVASDVLSALQAGDNVLVAEVHQVSATSSDLVFDAELVASDHPADRDVHGLGREAGNGFYLYWLDPAWQLEQSSDLVNWVSIPEATSPWPVSMDAPRSFFRWTR